jgi:hypothetical protein
MPFWHLWMNEAYVKIVGMDERGIKRGDYGQQRPTYRVNLPTQNTAQMPPSNQTQENSKSVRKKWKLPLFIVTTLLILLTAGGVGYDQYSKRQNALPASLAQTGDLKVYYPSALPDGFALDKSSAQSSGEVVSYALTNDTGAKITVSTQPKPAGLDTSILSGGTKFTTSLGEVQDLSSSDKGIYIVTTPDNQLIYINSTLKLSSASATQLINSLRSIK